LTLTKEVDPAGRPRRLVCVSLLMSAAVYRAEQRASTFFYIKNVFSKRTKKNEILREAAKTCESYRKRHKYATLYTA
jgi:hypothetical protein